MSDKFFEVFKQPTDHNRWNKQIEYISSLDGIEDNLRGKLISAINFLEQELGKGFLKTTSGSHPVKQKISNKAEWQIHELIQFVDTLKEIKENDCNYPKLIKKLFGYNVSITEGIPFVDIAGSYLKENLHVFFLDEIKKVRTPDIEILNLENNDKFFVEVSIVDNSDESKLITDNYYFLFESFHFSAPICFFTGKQKTIISKDDYPEIEKIVTDAKLRSIQNQQIISFSDKRLEFSILPDDNIDLLDKICSQNDTRRNEISGLPQNFDETDRLINYKIEDKAQQIPVSNNGILYFPVDPLYFLGTDICDSIDRLQDYITRFTNLIGIVLYSKIQISNAEDSFLESKKNVISRKVIKGALCRELLFVYNNHCNLKISSETLQKIYDSFK